MNSDVSEIKSRLNIVDVLGEYIRLEKAGSNWRALCPFHNEKTPSFMVSEERQSWHCFGCQKGGDIFSFVMEIDGLEFSEALKMLAEKAGVELKKIDPKATERKNRTLEILEIATKFYEFQLWEGPGKTKILNYLHKRGLKDETIKKFRLGYAPKGWDNMIKFLTKRGYGIEEINRTGLLVEKNKGKKDANNFYDRFRSRVMFPIADYSGKILGYSARVSPGEDESQAKYINTPESEVYHKSRILYGIDKARARMKQDDFVVLVEGNMDVIAANQAGLENAIAVSGTALTPDQIDIIKRYTKNIRMFFDMDKAGEMATKKSVKLCFEKDMNVKIVQISSGKDAADIAKENPEILKEAVKNAKNVMEYFFEINFSKFDKNNVEGRRKITENLLEIIGDISNEIEKNFWIKKLSAEMEISEAVLADMLKKFRLKDRFYNEKNQEEKKDEFITREKIDVLLEELIGLMLVSKEAWMEAEKLKQYYQFFQKDSLLKTMIDEGEKFSYNFDNLVAESSEKNKKRAEDIFFRKKFQLGINNSLEEVTINEPFKDFKKILEDIKSEIKKINIDSIAKDLKLAENNNDKETIRLLTEELNKVMAE